MRSLLAVLFIPSLVAGQSTVRAGDTVRLRWPNSREEAIRREGVVSHLTADGANVDFLPVRGDAGPETRIVAWSHLEMCVDRHRRVGEGLVGGAIGGALIGMLFDEVYTNWNGGGRRRWPLRKAAVVGASIGVPAGIIHGYHNRVGHWAPVTSPAARAAREVECGRMGIPGRFRR